MNIETEFSKKDDGKLMFNKQLNIQRPESTRNYNQLLRLSLHNKFSKKDNNILTMKSEDTLKKNKRFKFKVNTKKEMSIVNEYDIKIE